MTPQQDVKDGFYWATWRDGTPALIEVAGSVAVAIEHCRTKPLSDFTNLRGPISPDDWERLDKVRQVLRIWIDPDSDSMAMREIRAILGPGEVKHD